MIKRWIRKFRERIRWFSWMYCAIDIIQGRLITMVTVSQTKYCQKLLSNRLFKKEFRHLDDHQRNYHAPSKRLGYIVSPCFWLQNRCSEYNISTSQFFLEHHESSTSPLLWNLEANHQLLLQSFFFLTFLCSLSNILDLTLSWNIFWAIDQKREKRGRIPVLDNGITDLNNR